MVDSRVFYKHLKRHLNPHFKTLEFKPRGRENVRYRAPFIHCVGFQTDKGGGSCCVELGVHLDFLPLSHGPMPDVAKMAAYTCEIRRRMLPADGMIDYWWTFGNDDVSSEESAKSLASTFQERGLSFFNQYTSISEAFQQFTPEDLHNGRAPSILSLTEARASLLLVRIHTHLGLNDKARTFAQAGLDMIGTKDFYWRQELEDAAAGKY